MDYDTYNTICDSIKKYGGRDRLSTLIDDFPSIDPKTLANIASQNYQIKMKKTHYVHHNPENVEAYYQRYMNTRSGGVNNTIVTLADIIDLSPALLARIILERHLHVMSEALPRSLVTQRMRNTALISDATLATDVYACIVADKNYGPMADIAKHSIGHEYECLLKRQLDTRGLSYISEATMRDRGYDKTPDVKLEIPIAVDGYVVNWIESKASFGDLANHRSYEKDQYWCYWNRFGPGMVIYWFGFIQDLDVNRNKGIIVSDHFPDDIVTMSPTAESVT